MKGTVCVWAALLAGWIAVAPAEDGRELWLRYDTVSPPPEVISGSGGVTTDIAAAELRRHWRGGPVRLKRSSAQELQALTEEGFLLEGDVRQGVTISSAGEAGLLYGAWHLLRLQATGTLPADGNISVQEMPRFSRRILNHWDNLDDTVERGYAGASIWGWTQEQDSAAIARYRQYARANASIGLNGTVLNNVNASPAILTPPMLARVKVIADVLRPYGMRVYLSVNFDSPAALGGLASSDPLDKKVRRWWADKAEEIYALIPDFGGFLVKANSEGLPGPQDFGRTHADGANMLADALRPFGGAVMWRAFVYSPSNEDRAKQAALEFLPLDGQFDDNVLIQVKNGPIDFQPREPFSPLFGLMQQTPLMPELQITQEYLGQGNHLVFLATMWKEFFESDTYALGAGSTVAEMTDGTLRPQPLTAIAGVANTGRDANWCGQHFGQANWYAFGRLAWDHTLTAETIAEEWLKQTFTVEEDFLEPMKTLMVSSHETAVDYMMPLGLHHIFAWEHHYGPEPWTDIPGAREDWMPRYYHRADSIGIGFDRSGTGGAVEQYAEPLRREWGSREHCPEELLLWFHHVRWDDTLANGHTLWDELCYRYDGGVQEVREYQRTWDKMEPYVDAERFSAVQRKLKIQAWDAVWWRDACLLYFQRFSHRIIPYEIERPVYDLDELIEASRPKQ
jgi:alpha-glucuronidase